MFTKLEFKDGWMGGSWLADGEPLKRLPSVVTLRIKRKLVNAEVVEYKGVDHDHGHQYSWSGIDFRIVLATDIGLVKASLRELKYRFKVEIDV